MLSISKTLHEILFNSTSGVKIIDLEEYEIFPRKILEIFLQIYKNQSLHLEDTINKVTPENKTQEFIIATTRMWLLFKSKKYYQIQTIHVKWQDRVDKFSLNDPICTFIGLYYLILGLAFYELDEYEISVSFFLKSNYYYRFGEMEEYLALNHKLISQVYHNAGYYYESNYHKIEAQKFQKIEYELDVLFDSIR